MTLDNVLVVCILLQFALLLVLFGWRSGTEHKLDVVYAIGIVAALWVLVLVLVSLTALTYQTLQLTGVMR